MRPTIYVRGAALIAAAAVIGLSAAPATAATVAQGSATALSLELAGTGATDSGTYTVTNDGESSTTSGNNKPLVTALGGQSAISAGTLAQDAVAGVKNGKGYSAACSGLAGNGATLVAAGSGDCLTGGETLNLSVGSLDLSNLDVASSDLFAGLDTTLKSQLKPVQDALTGTLSSALKQALDGLGDPGLHLGLGAVQSHCNADTRSATGDSTLADAGAYVTIPGQGDVKIADIPANPKVNQKVVTDLSGVTDTILNAVRTDLTETLGGALSPLSGAVGTLQTQVLDGVLSQVSAQLKPIEDNLLDITLNKQTRGPDSIAVTALDVSVAPAAKQFVNADLAHVTIGTSKCGPNGIYARNVPAAVPPKAAPAAPANIPTAVDAGLKSYDDGQSGRIALVTLLLLAAAGTGVGAYVRSIRRG